MSLDLHSQTSKSSTVVKASQGPTVYIKSTHSLTGAPSTSSSTSTALSVGGKWATPTSTSVQTKVETTVQISTVRNRIKWRKGACVGQGGFGKVYTALNEDTGELLAVKVMEFHADQKIVERLTALQSEIKVMKELKHENIVRYVCSERVGNTFNIFMEYVPGGSVASLMRNYGKLNESIVSMYTRDITRALQYLHNRDVVHRDVKAANVLLNVKGDVKLADFGSALWLKEQKGLKGKNVTHGTPKWMSPEVITSSECTTCSDIWSLGCTIMEMLTAKEPWHHVSSNNLAVMRFVGDDTKPITLPSVPLSDDCQNLITGCLQRDPQKRLTTLDILKHPFGELIEKELLGTESDPGSAGPPRAMSPDDTVLTEFHAGSAMSSDGPEMRYAADDGLAYERKGSRKRCKMPNLMLTPGLVHTPSFGSNPFHSQATPSPTTTYATEMGRVPSVGKLPSLGRGSTYRTNPVRASRNIPPEQQRIQQCLISSCLSLNGIDFDEDDMETIISGRYQGSPMSTALPVRETSFASVGTDKPTTMQEAQDRVVQMLSRNIADQQDLERHVVFLDNDVKASSGTFRYDAKTWVLFGKKYKRTAVLQTICVVCLVLVILILVPFVLLQRSA